MSESGDATAMLQRDLERLVERCRPWSSARWETRAQGRQDSRGDVAYALVVTLARLCPLTPAGVIPPRLRDLALADQIALVGGELTAWLASSGDESLAQEAYRLVRETRDALEPAPLG